MRTAHLNAGIVTLNGIAVTLDGGDLIDYSAGRLAYSADDPRAGSLLNSRPREGRVVNAARRGLIMEIA